MRQILDSYQLYTALCATSRDGAFPMSSQVHTIQSYMNVCVRRNYLLDMLRTSNLLDISRCGEIDRGTFKQQPFSLDHSRRELDSPRLDSTPRSSNEASPSGPDSEQPDSASASQASILLLIETASSLRLQRPDARSLWKHASMTEPRA